jgi:hypothetical protein
MQGSIVEFIVVQSSLMKFEGSVCIAVRSLLFK